MNAKLWHQPYEKQDEVFYDITWQPSPHTQEEVKVFDDNLRDLINSFLNLYPRPIKCIAEHMAKVRSNVVKVRYELGFQAFYFFLKQGVWKQFEALANQISSHGEPA